MVIITSAVGALEKSKLWKGAVASLDLARLRGIQLDSISYVGALSSCEKGDRWEALLEMLARRKRWGPSPGVIDLSIAISACEGSKRWELVSDMLAEMQELRLQPDRRISRSMFTDCEQRGYSGRHLVISHLGNF